MHAKVMVFGVILCFVGFAFFLHGASLSNQVMNPENLISGTFYVVVGIFLGIAGVLMLIMQMFQRNSLSH